MEVNQIQKETQTSQKEGAQTSHEKSDIKNYIIVALATALIVLGLVWIRDSGNTDVPTGNVPAAVGAAQVPSAPRVPLDMNTLADDDPFLGKEDDPVVIIEWSDYECPFCERFFSQTLPQIKEKYIKTGKVKLVYRDFPLDIHPEATPAALAANCAGKQDKYFEFHDKIFENQQSMGSTSYKKWAQEVGVDVSAWEKCTKDPQQLQEVTKDLSDGAQAGIRGTPGFIINGQLVSGAQPFSVFEQIIEAELS